MSDLSNRQAAAGRQGAQFEAAVKVTLQIEGWTVTAERWRHPDLDVEVDFVATDPLGQEWWIECKGSWEGNRPGLARTDTVKKAVSNAALLFLDPDHRPFLLVASHPPKGGAGAVWLRRARDIGWIDEVRFLGLGASA